MKQLITDLHPIRSGVVCDGLDTCMERLKRDLPFHVHEFNSGDECNGWIVPQKWEVETATIHQDGQLIYDGNASPLGVIGYSQAFSGAITGADLKEHLFYSQSYPDELIYHCDLYYKPHLKQWGFSVPKTFYDSLFDSHIYEVRLKTTFSPGTMKVAEYVLHGELTDSIILCAHICHPGLSNDDLTGVAVGIDVMKKLALLGQRRFTYRLLVLPEHYGSIFWLDRFRAIAFGAKFGLFLESVGTDGPLALQRSFNGQSMIDRALINALKYSGLEWRTDEFRKIVGNDETCFDSVGYEIPCPSLSRVPFPEYHTSLDSPAIISEERLEEASDVTLRALLMLDREITMETNIDGLVCLSNPKYDLYKPMMDPSIPDRRTITPMMRRFNWLMDCLPRYFTGEIAIMDIAERHDLPWQVVYDYVKEFEAKDLVHTTPIYWHTAGPQKLEPK